MEEKKTTHFTTLADESSHINNINVNENNNNLLSSNQTAEQNINNDDDGKVNQVVDKNDNNEKDLNEDHAKNDEMLCWEKFDQSGNNHKSTTTTPPTTTTSTRGIKRPREDDKSYPIKTVKKQKNCPARKSTKKKPIVDKPASPQAGSSKYFDLVEKSFNQNGISHKSTTTTSTTTTGIKIPRDNTDDTELVSNEKVDAKTYSNGSIRKPIRDIKKKKIIEQQATPTADEYCCQYFYEGSLGVNTVITTQQLQKALNNAEYSSLLIKEAKQVLGKNPSMFLVTLINFPLNPSSLDAMSSANAKEEEVGEDVIYDRVQPDQSNENRINPASEPSTKDIEKKEMKLEQKTPKKEDLDK